MTLDQLGDDDPAQLDLTAADLRTLATLLRAQGREIYVADWEDDDDVGRMPIVEIRPDGIVIEEISDGFHTFAELYEHRAGLTAALYSHLGPHERWRSKLHHDGTMYDGFFIVGMQLDDKWVTYHYPADYWIFFGGPTLDKAPEWDGANAGESVQRLLAYARLEADETQF